MAAVTFYSYYLLSKVLELCEKQGRRHIRFRELAADVLGNRFCFLLLNIFECHCFIYLFILDKLQNQPPKNGVIASLVTQISKI